MKNSFKPITASLLVTIALSLSGCSPNVKPVETVKSPEITQPTVVYSDQFMDDAILEAITKTEDLEFVDFSDTRVKECSDYIFISNADKLVHPLLQSCLDDTKLAIKLLTPSTSRVVSEARDALEAPNFSDQYRDYLNKFISAPQFVSDAAPDFKNLCTRSNIEGKLFNEKATNCGISMIQIMTFARSWNEVVADYSNR